MLTRTFLLMLGAIAILIFMILQQFFEEGVESFFFVLFRSIIADKIETHLLRFGFAVNQVSNKFCNISSVLSQEFQLFAKLCILL